MTRKYKLSATDIKPILNNQGGCIASIRITVDGAKVGYCYREASDNDLDNGWRFFAGDESDEYTNDPNNAEIYDINTIANYDPRIISIIDAPVGSSYIDQNGQLVPDNPPKSWWQKLLN